MQDAATREMYQLYARLGDIMVNPMAEIVEFSLKSEEGKGVVGKAASQLSNDGWLNDRMVPDNNRNTNDRPIANNAG